MLLVLLLMIKLKRVQTMVRRVMTNVDAGRDGDYGEDAGGDAGDGAD